MSTCWNLYLNDHRHKRLVIMKRLDSTASRIKKSDQTLIVQHILLKQPELVGYEHCINILLTIGEVERRFATGIKDSHCISFVCGGAIPLQSCLKVARQTRWYLAGGGERKTNPKLPLYSL